MMELPQILITAAVSVASTLLSFWIGWILCSRSSATNRAVVDELMKQNKALQNKLVADSLPAYISLQRADNGASKRPPIPQRAEMPQDPYSRGLDEDEWRARMEEAAEEQEII